MDQRYVDDVCWIAIYLACCVLYIKYDKLALLQIADF